MTMDNDLILIKEIINHLRIISINKQLLIQVSLDIFHM